MCLQEGQVGVSLSGMAVGLRVGQIGLYFSDTYGCVFKRDRWVCLQMRQIGVSLSGKNWLVFE